MPNYSQAYNNEMARAAREAFNRLCRGETELFLYFKPQGMRLHIVGWNEPHEGLELVTGDRIPSNLTVEQLTGRFHDLCRRIPLLPTD